MSGDILVVRDEGRHAFASPSMFGAIKACPYTAWCRYGWNEPERPAAMRGRLLHEAVYSEEAYGRVTDAEDRALVDMIRRDFVEPMKGMEHYFELRLELVDEEGRIRTFGTADFVALDKEKRAACLRDWKYGSIAVEVAKDNDQIHAYVAMLFQRFPDIDTVYALIVQPALGEVDFGATAVFTREADYKRFYDDAIAVCEMAEKATPEDARPTPESCRWCNCMGCEAWRKVMNAALQDWCQSADLPAERPMTEPSTELVTYCDEGLDQLTIIKNFVAAKEAEMKRVIVAAGGSPNYRVANGRVTKTTDWKAVAQECGIPREVIDAHTVAKIGEPYAVRKSRK